MFADDDLSGEGMPLFVIQGLRHNPRRPRLVAQQSVGNDPRNAEQALEVGTGFKAPERVVLIEAVRVNDHLVDGVDRNPVLFDDLQRQLDRACTGARSEPRLEVKFVRHVMAFGRSVGRQALAVVKPVFFHGVSWAFHAALGQQGRLGAELADRQVVHGPQTREDIELERQIHGGRLDHPGDADGIVKLIGVEPE